MPGSSWLRTLSWKSSCRENMTMSQVLLSAQERSEERDGGSLHRGPGGQCRTSRAWPCRSSDPGLASFFLNLWNSTYHGDRDVRRIGEDESDLIELAATAPVLREGHPIPESITSLKGMNRQKLSLTIRRRWRKRSRVSSCCLYPRFMS